jgi:hypothetical protein
MQWPKENRTKEETTIYKTIHRKTKYRGRQIPLIPGGELMVSTSKIRPVTCVAKPVISHE